PSVARPISDQQLLKPKRLYPSWLTRFKKTPIARTSSYSSVSAPNLSSGTFIISSSRGTDQHRLSSSSRPSAEPRQSNLPARSSSFPERTTHPNSDPEQHRHRRGSGTGLHSGPKLFMRMAQLTRNHTLPTPTSNKASTSTVFRTSHSNVFSFPAITLARTGSGKSFSVDMTGVTSLPIGSRSKSKDTYSRSGWSKDSDISLAPIIAAIKRGNFLQLSDTNLDLLIRVMAGKNSNALETISLTALAISGTDGKLLARLIKSSKAANIKVLKLNRNAISQQASKVLFEALKANKSITTLTMVRSGVNDKIVKYIAKALAKNDTLKELDLSSNRITAQGTEDLCEALIYNRSLTRLCLESNNIRSPGAPALARLLAKNRVIRHLNVGSNGLGCEGCILIAESVRFNRTLTSLSLDLNEMGPKGGAAMAVALVSNRHLTHLYMPHNNIGDQG
ncbi:hypothetical protein BGZ70_005586, partial [Mortierella alpina]